MSKRLAQNDPALAIEFFISGFYTHRSQLFAPFKGIGVNVVSFHDPVIDGKNMEDTDLYEWQRRSGFSMFCSVNLADNEIVNDFYSFRNLNGSVVALFDSTERIATFTFDEIDTIITKTTTQQGFVNTVGNMMYFSDGASADMLKWDSVAPLTSINPSTWGIPAPTLTPTLFSQGCWLPFTNFIINNAILDPNGSVEVVTATFGGSSVSGGNQPLWPTTISSTINDGSIQWTNMGPLLSWLPAQFYPVPVVVLDTNGNLQLATVTTPTVVAWNSTDSYTVGTVVLFAGLYWAALVDNTGVPPSEQYVVTTAGVTQPYWVQTQSPSTTGTYSVSPFAPNWNKTVGGQTTDGNYVWTNLGPGVLVESFGTSYVYCYRTIYGHLSTASPISINTGSIFGPQIATITSFSITSNVVTFQGVNNFIPGNQFSVQGLSVGTYLNNQTFIVQATGLTPTQFSATFTYPDVPSTNDSGATVNFIASLTGEGTSSPLCNATASITASQVVAGVVTLYAVNDFVPGLQVTLTGLTFATFLNNLQFQIINVDPNGQWFQVYFTTNLGVVPPNQPITTDTGTATFNSIEVYRVSDGGGIYLFCGAVTNPVSQGPSQPYDSGLLLAGTGSDNGTPGTYVWSDPNNVTGDSGFATVSVPAPTMSGSGRFNSVQKCQTMSVRLTAGHPSLPANRTITASFTQPNTAGNSILVFITVENNGVAPTMSDTQGNTYQLVAQEMGSGAGSRTVVNSIYLANNIGAGPNTVNVAVDNPNHDDFAGFIATEVSGLAGTFETPASSGQISGTSFTPGTVTTLQANEVVVSFIYNQIGRNSSNSVAYPGAYSLFSSQVVFNTQNGNTYNGYEQMAAVYQVQAATGSFAPTWFTPSNNPSVGITVALPLFVYNLSDGLDAKNFDFTVPQGIGITGIQVKFNATFNGVPGDGLLDIQLLQNGIPVGSIISVTPQVSLGGVPYTIGGPGNTFGFRWQPSDVNSSTWGVRFIATQRVGGGTAVFGVNDVNVKITGQTSTGWSFTDFTPDNDLNILLIAPQNHQNDPPPGAPGSSINSPIGTITRYWQGRLFMVVGNYVYFDAGPDCTNGIPEESWPPSNRFQFPGPVFALEPTADGVGLLVYLADRVAAILGGPETISFYATDALSNFGISNPNAIFRDGSIIGQFTTQRQYFEILGSQKEEIGEHIADYLTANFTAAKTYVTMHRDGLDVGMFLSNGVDQIVRFGSNIGAWSVPAFPVMGAGALQSIETSVGVYSLMLASPTGGVSAATIPTTPQLGVSAGTGTAWINPENITLGSPTDYATLSISGTASQVLQASDYILNIPANAVISGVQLSVTGKGSSLSSGPINAGIGVNISAPFSAAWTTPNNITLNTPGTYAIAALNAPPASPVPNNQTNIFAQSPAFGPAAMAVTASGTAINIGDIAFVMLDLGDAFSLGPVTIASFVDDKGNIWTPVAPLQLAHSNTISFVTYSAVMGTAIPISSTLNITVTFNENCRVNVMGFVNIPGLLAQDQQAQAASDSVPNAVSGIINIGQSELVLSFVYDFVSISAGSQPVGWSNLGIGVSGGNGAWAAYLLASPGTVTDQWTSSWPWAATMVSFTLAASQTVVNSDLLVTSTYGFAIPANSIILGVEAEIFGLQTVVSATTNITATLNAGGTVRNFNLTTSQGSAIFGGATDPWGLVLTPAIVNDPAFGLTIQAFDSNFSEAVTFKLSAAQLKIWYAATLNAKPLNAVAGASVKPFGLGASNTTVVLGGPTDLWGMPWVSPSAVNNRIMFGFELFAPGAQTADFSVSEMQVIIFYQAPGNYLYARDTSSWGDGGQYGQNNGTAYGSCYITVGSITLTQLGAPLIAVQHFVGYFDPAGTLGEGGGPSIPSIWWLPNEVNANSGIGFIQLPDAQPEPPTGQNVPSKSIIARRWPINAANSELASQYVHHLQVKIQFEPESAPNTIKAIAFKEHQDD